MNFGPECDVLTMKLVVPMFLDALCMYLMCHFRMEIKYPSGILGHVLVSSLVSLTYTLLLCRWY